MMNNDDDGNDEDEDVSAGDECAVLRLCCTALVARENESLAWVVTRKNLEN